MTKEMLQRYLDELEGNQLEVVLIPQREFTNIGGMVRAVQSQNTEWYRKFCEEHASNRNDYYRWSKFKTKVKRQDTIRGLRELIAGKRESFYARDLANFLKRWAEIETEREDHMIPSNPRHSSAKENWGSPPWIVEAARKVMGSIDLDPASSAEANKVIQAGHYFTKGDDGLSRLWRLNSQEPHKLNVWLNPPGGKTDDAKSKVKLWWQKNLTQRSGLYFAQGMFLSFSIEACQVTQLNCEHSLLDFPTCFFKKRVDYLDPITGKPVKGNTHSSCITYVPGSVNETPRFYEIFKEFGKVTLGYEDHFDAEAPVLNDNDFGGLGLPL